MAIHTCAFILLLTLLFACNLKHGRHKHSAQAIKLNDSAVAVSFSMTDTAYGQAIALLDKATAIDSNYYKAYNNKLRFQMKLRQYDNALVTANNLIRIKPSAPDVYITAGILYEKKNDTIAAKQYFQKAQVLYSSILDTMNSANKSREIVMMKKAVGLIMLGDAAAGNKQLQQLYTAETDTAVKEEIASFINKDKTELMKIFTGENK